MMSNSIRKMFCFVFVLLFVSLFCNNIVYGEGIGGTEAYNDFQENCDVISYDKNGNEYFYSYDDFIYEDCELDGFVPQTQEKPNDRNPFNKYYVLPYSAICVVFTSFDTNSDGISDVTYVGSGTLVGPDVILTAEENTYNTEYGYPTNLTVVPGGYSNNAGQFIKPFGEQTWTVILRGNYHSTFDASDNWAIIRIDSQIGYSAEWMSVSDTGISNGSTVYTLGYSRSTIYDYEVVETHGIVASLQTYKFNHTDLPHVMSNGAPVIDPNLSKVYGINSGPRVYDGDLLLSQACKVSIYIKNWIQEDGGALELRIFASADGGSSSLNFSGHSWLTVKNNSPYNVLIGKMTISPNETVSLGTWGNKIHDGLYYNLEHYFDINYNSYNNNSCYKKNMFIYQWNNINSVVLNNDSWSYFDNCASFAIDVWNAAMPQYSFSKPEIPTPSQLKSQINSLSDHMSNVPVFGGLNVGYYNGDNFIYSIS